MLNDVKFEALLHNNVMVVAMKENSGGQTQFVENSHGGEDILNFIAFIPRHKTDNDYFRNLLSENSSYPENIETLNRKMVIGSTLLLQIALLGKTQSSVVFYL